ncbi:MAG TPA: FtsX-like permease family protein [Gemmatimonadaceae bacterium]|jgi:putative ABC transport system permease protein|nr:FtsX-like permease family protein [Gemmatimonadaceae bacterium]
MILVRRAWNGLTHHRGRTLLAIVGVAVSAAMLLDMVMLSSGMRASFKSLLLSRGFQLRLAPKGTLPFDTDATIPGAAGIAVRLRSISGVSTISPVLGGQLHVVSRGNAFAAVALGVDPTAQGDYEILMGRAPRSPNELAASDDFLAAAHAQVGDTVSAAGGYDAQLRELTRERTLTIVARVHFLYMPAGQRAVALPLATLQAMEGPSASDRVSLFMIKAAPGQVVDSVLRRIESALPTVSAVSTETAMRQVDDRLSYFRQLSFILGAVSLGVGLLLVATLVTVSVNERLGEIVVMRAIGVARSRVVAQILLESVGIMLGGAVAGLALGLLTAHYLNSILAAFPGLPAAIDFFFFEPKDAWTALGLLAAAGVIAGVYPAWRGASLPIAVTLREEAAA